MTTGAAPTSCPTWCDAGGEHRPAPDGCEVQHEGVTVAALPFGLVRVESWATGPDVDQPASLSVDLQADGLDVEAGERLVAALAAAVEQLRQARPTS